MAGPQEPQAPGAPPQKVENPILGLFLDRPPHTIQPTGFSACNNVRVELGRVRSDLIGWQATTLTSGPVPAAIVWADNFSVTNVPTPFLVTNTDILQVEFLTQTTYATAYVTPLYTTGLASVNNGATSVSGSSGTHWAGDVTGGSQTFNASTTISAGATSITVNVSAANGFLLNALVGMPIADVTQPGALLNGTYLASVSESAGACTLGLSQPVQLSIPATDTLFLGTGQTVRQNVRVGDQIAFGTTNPNAGGLTWYKVTAVGVDGTGASSGTSSLTIGAPFAGSNFGPGPYVIRQCLTNTLAETVPFLPQSSSDNIQFPSGYNGIGNNAICAGIWFYTNGLDPVVLFFDTVSGPTSCQYARSLQFTCASLKQFKGLMVYGGLNVDTAQLGASIASSDNNLPLQMNSGVAFQGIATSGPFTISRMAILGSTLMLYGTGEYSGGTVAEDASSGVVTSASLVGYPTIWAFSDVIQTRGPVSGGAVAIFPDRHEFLSIDGEYRYNGLFVQIMNDHIWRAVMKGFDFSRNTSCYAAIVPTYGDVLWVTPQTSDPANQVFASSAYAEHYMEQANSYLFKPYTKRDFPFSTVFAYQTFGVFASPQIQPYYYAGDTSGNLWQLYTQTNQNVTSPLCTVTWASRILGTGRTRDLVRRVYPFLEYQASPVSTVNVTLTMQDRPAGPTTITDTQTFNLTYAAGATNTGGFTSHFRRGRVASVTLSDSAGVGWVADGYDWDVTQGGWR